MLLTPRIIAIDDNEKHLDGIAKGLNQYGAACLPIHFTGESDDIGPYPHVRAIFADLHLIEGGPGNDQTQHFSIIVSLIEDNIKPSGPYVLILWTGYADEADGLQQFLDDRLPEDVPKPLAVEAIDKINYLSTKGVLKKTNNLLKKIDEYFIQQPQIASLLNWEEKVLDSAAETVSSIFSLATTSSNTSEQKKVVGRLLARLAVEAVGEDHVEKDHFRAVNEALLPILVDHIATKRSSGSEKKIWQNAFSSSDAEHEFTLSSAAKLNNRIHIEHSTEEIKGTERGAVIALPDKYSKTFEETFSLKQEEAAQNQFHCKNFAISKDECRWVLIQCQAACDYAQTQPGPLPYYLGLELPENSISKNKKPQALWASPPFSYDGEVFYLHVNSRFPISLNHSESENAQIRYRLREQLISYLIFHIHTYGARPGVLSFRKIKSK